MVPRERGGEGLGCGAVGEEGGGVLGSEETMVIVT